MMRVQGRVRKTARAIATLGAVVLLLPLTAGGSSGDGRDTRHELSVGAEADDAEVGKDGPGPDAEILAEQYGVSVEVMYEYMQAEERLGVLANTARKLAGDRLAGSWLEWNPGPHLVVSLTDGPALPEVEGVLDAARESVEVRYGAKASLATLRAGAAVVYEKLAPAAGLRVSTYVLESGGQVVVTVEGVGTGDASAADIAAFTDSVSRVGVPVTVKTTGGSAQYENRGGRFLTQCTSAFVVWNEYYRGYLTAGHCGSTQDYKWWSDGSWRPTTYVRELWDYLRDVQLHRHVPGQQLFEPLFHASVADARHQDGVYSYGEGSNICKWGSRSNVTLCTKVTAIDFRPASCGPYNGPCADVFVIVNLSDVAISCRGDSGGPWFHNNLAAGIHSGAANYYSDDQACISGTNRYAYFTPISNALGPLGVALLTSP